MSATVDGLLDPEQASRFLRYADEVDLRLAPIAGEAGAPPYGPEPVEPVLVHLRRGERTATTQGADTSRPIEAITLETKKLAWGGWGGAPFEKILATVEVRIGGVSYLAAQSIGSDEARAPRACAELSEALEAFCAGAEAEHDSTGDVDATSSPAARRFAFVLEGDYLVLRDFETRGPRQGMGTYVAISAACLVLSGLVWLGFARELSGPRVLSSLLGYAALGLVLALGALAMGEIARFASKYRGKGAPLAWFHDDRVVVAPWVSRTGAIDRQPAGQFGAAIRIPEIDDVCVKEDQGASVVWLDTQHGPIDVVTIQEPALAKLYREALVRALLAVAAPAKRPRGLLRVATAAA